MMRNAGKLAGLKRWPEGRIQDVSAARSGGVSDFTSHDAVIGYCKTSIACSAYHAGIGGHGRNEERRWWTSSEIYCGAGDCVTAFCSGTEHCVDEILGTEIRESAVVSGAGRIKVGYLGTMNGPQR